MKRILIAMAVLAVTALPSFAHEMSSMPDIKGTSQNEPMMQNPEMMKQMMRNPQHVLMMAYHKNVVIFGEALAKVARQGETVPPQVARTAIAEMRRSADEMEKYRASAMSGMPAGMKGREEMQKMMDEHLVQMKTELRQLDELAQKDPIPSAEVLKHLQFILQRCDRMMHGCGMRGRGGMGGCGCGSQMPGHRQATEEMTRKMKAQDQELAKKVARMNRAPKDRKVTLLADIVSQMVKQRAEMTSHMEKMQQGMQGAGCMKYRGMQQMQQMQQENAAPSSTTGGGGEDEESVEGDETEY